MFEVFWQYVLCKFIDIFDDEAFFIGSPSNELSALFILCYYLVTSSIKTSFSMKDWLLCSFFPLLPLRISCLFYNIILAVFESSLFLKNHILRQKKHIHASSSSFSYYGFLSSSREKFLSLSFSSFIFRGFSLEFFPLS